MIYLRTASCALSWAKLKSMKVVIIREMYVWFTVFHCPHSLPHITVCALRFISTFFTFEFSLMGNFFISFITCLCQNLMSVKSSFAFPSKFTILRSNMKEFAPLFFIRAIFLIIKIMAGFNTGVCV